MMEEIKHITMVKFLREHSLDDLFIKWQRFPLTQKFFWGVVYQLYQENLLQKKMITKLMQRIGIVDVSELEEEPLDELTKDKGEPILKELMEKPEVETTGQEDECPYCDKSFNRGKAGFALRMHIAREHKDEFREWEKEHGKR